MIQTQSSVGLNPPLVAELQDQLLTAATDLDRLGGLLDHAAERLMGSFLSARDRLAAPGSHPCSASADSLDGLRRDLDEAITAMQFPDMAGQVITHAVRRIQGVADALAAEVGDPGEDAAAPVLIQRSCPVAQREMDAGSVELF